MLRASWPAAGVATHSATPSAAGTKWQEYQRGALVVGRGRASAAVSRVARVDWGQHVGGWEGVNACSAGHSDGRGVDDTDARTPNTGRAPTVSGARLGRPN